MAIETHIHLFWYKDAATYLHFKDVCVDQDVFEHDYQEWLKNVEKSMSTFKKAGIPVHKVYADPDEFLLWCKANALPPNGAARGQYAASMGDADSHSCN